MILLALILNLGLAEGQAVNSRPGVLIWADLSGETPVIEAYGERTYFESDVTTAPGSHQLWTFYSCRQREMGRTRVWDPRWVGGGHAFVGENGELGERIPGRLDDRPVEGEAIAPRGAAYFTISLDVSEAHPEGAVLGPFALPLEVFPCAGLPTPDFQPGPKRN
ncbi:hypothetical protein [Maricaulis sp. MIT060901]|uniref:hypothetical protein n=1 Tax=Maricaulis sp. MIT060901 TaxID=3096993 RepID=UPI00399B3FF0